MRPGDSESGRDSRPASLAGLSLSDRPAGGTVTVAGRTVGPPAGRAGYGHK